MSINSFSHNLREKTQYFNDSVAQSSPVQCLKAGGKSVAKKFDALPRPVKLALQIIPGINLIAIPLAEKGLDYRCPDKKALSLAEKKYEAITGQVAKLAQQRKYYQQTISKMEEKRANLEENEPDSHGLIKIKDTLSHKWARYKNSEKKQTKLEKEHTKIQTILAKFSTDEFTQDLPNEIERLKQTIDPEEAKQIDQERKELRIAFRVGAVVLTGVAIAAIAIATFTAAPAIICFMPLIALGIGVGTHIAFCKSEEWQVNGEMNLEMSKASAAAEKATKGVKGNDWHYDPIELEEPESKTENSTESSETETENSTESSETETESSTESSESKTENSTENSESGTDSTTEKSETKTESTTETASSSDLETSQD